MKVSIQQEAQFIKPGGFSALPGARNHPAAAKQVDLGANVRYNGRQDDG